MRRRIALLLIFLCTMAGGCSGRGSTEDIANRLKAGRFDEVDAYYRTVRTAAQRNAEGNSRLSDVYEQLPTRADVLPLLDGWCTRTPHSVYAFTQRGIWYLAYAWQARGSSWAFTVSDAQRELFNERIKKAQADLEQAHRLDPTLPQAAAQLIVVATALGWTRDAMEAQFQRAIKADPRDVDAYLNKLTYLMPKWHNSREDIARAAPETLADPPLKGRPDPKALDRALYAEMFAFAREAAAQAPSGTSLPRLLINAHWEYYDRLDDPTYFRDPQVWAEMEGAFSRLLADFPRSDLLHADYGVTAAYADRPDLAMAQFRQIRHLTSLGFNRLAALEGAYDRLGRRAKMVSVYLQWARAHPKNPSPYFKLGRLCQDLAQAQNAVAYYQKAIQRYRAAIEERPDYSLQYFYLASCYDEVEPAKAVDLYRRYLLMAPRDILAYEALARCLIYHVNQPREAEPIIARGLEIDPGNVNLHYDLADVLGRRGDLDGKMRELRSVLRLDPASAIAHGALGQALLDKGRAEEAIAEYREALRLNPRYVMGYYDLGAVLYDTGRYAESLRAFERFLELNPPDLQGLVQTARRTVEQLKNRGLSRDRQ